jgi:hypothetical protein
MTRGRLIFPFYAELHRFDAQATARDDDGPGPVPAGFDPDFQESIVDTTTARPRRRELPPIRVPCQIEPEAFETLAMTAAGNAPRSAMTLVMHLADLEALGLVDGATGNLRIGINDRLAAAFDRHGRQVFTAPDPPGLFVTEVRPAGFGLGGRRNLVFVFFDARSRAPRVVS